MRPLRLAAVLVFAFGACRGVSIRPEVADASTIPAVSLSADSLRELATAVDGAITAVVRRRYGEAEQQALAALAIDPRCARARSVLGMVRFQAAALSDPPDLFLANEGETEVLLALQIAPDDAFVGWIHAVFLAESGHMSAAAAAAEASLERAKDAPAIERAALLGTAGTYRYELGEERAALPHLQTYIALRPDDAAACFRIGSCLLRKAAMPLGSKTTALEQAQRDAEAAARAFARCVELAPGDEDAALAVAAATKRAAELAAQRGEKAVAEQRLDEAVQHCQGVAERFPTNAEAMFRIGVIAEERGSFDRAGEAYSQALLRDPRHLGSLLNLAALGERAVVVGAPAARELLLRALAVDAEVGGLTSDERRRIEARLRGA